MSRKASLITFYLISGLWIFVCFILFFIIFGNLLSLFYKSVFGSPEEMEWLLLFLLVQLSGVFGGFIGSIVGLIPVGIIANKYKSVFGAERFLLFKMLLFSYITFILIAVAVLVVTDPLIEICPNCVR